MVGKYLEIFHLGEGESAGLLKTNWEMSLTYSPEDIDIRISMAREG